MWKTFRKTLILLAGCALAGPPAALADPLAGDCPPQDLEVVLNTGWDESTGGFTLPTGADDDDWDVTVDASGGSTPRAAKVINKHPAWSIFPDSKWISAATTGPNGTYVYEICWCLEEGFSNPQLSFEVRADDEADVLLNGALVASTPAGSFNKPPTVVNVTDPTMFVEGENCLEVEVRNVYGVVTGMNGVGTFTADDGLCCACDAEDLLDDASTGIDDATNAPIAIGDDDDEWNVTVDASGGVVPRPAQVISKHPAWSLIPGTQWIAATPTGPNGLYVYEKCWCFNEAWENAILTTTLLADDRAEVFLNGVSVGATPATNAFQNPPTVIQVTDPALFRSGENCVEIHVENTLGVVTGLDAQVIVEANKAQCCDCTDLPLDPEGWWPLDEPTGPTAFESVNAYDGTHMQQVGSPPAPTPVPGKVAGALMFDGIDDYVEVPDGAYPKLEFAAGEDFSIDAWVQTLSLDRDPIVWKRGVGPSAGYAFYTSGGLLGFEMGDGTNNALCTGTTPLNDGLWHFVAVTVDRDLTNGIRLIVDGAVDASCDPTPVTGSTASNEPFYIGGHGGAPAGTDLFARATIDEVEVFRRALGLGEMQTIYLAQGSGKCPLTPCTEADAPVCDGQCPVGLVCVEDASMVTPTCHCEPEPTPCHEAEAPVCDGVCPEGLTCVDGAQGCDCQPITSSCFDASAPQCLGLCPNAEDECLPIDGSDLCDCFPPLTCGNSMYPECDGTCPDGEICVEGLAQDCGCVPIDTCENSPYPECNGTCPDGETCEVGPAQDCGCQPDPPVPCSESEYPVCDGECPDDLTCVDGGAVGCVCEQLNACEDSLWPTCGGNCPDGSTCDTVPGTNKCGCTPDPIVACGDAIAPACNGFCPGTGVCVESTVGTGCICQDCVISDPVFPSKPITVNFADGKKILWSEGECSLWHNLYRGVAPTLRDLDGDGLADDYGSCHQPDIIGNETQDTDPGPGDAHWYLVTGENYNSESSLGENSSGQERQATTVCP